MEDDFLKVKEKILSQIELYNEIYNKEVRDGILYKETSNRFPNGKNILCTLDAFINEFGDCEMDNLVANSFCFYNNKYTILKPVDYTTEMQHIIEESPIIVGEEFAFEMKSYKREMPKKYLLRGDFINKDNRI